MNALLRQLLRNKTVPIGTTNLPRKNTRIMSIIFVLFFLSSAEPLGSVSL